MQTRLALVSSILLAAGLGAQDIVVNGRLVDGHGAPIPLAEVKVNRARVATNDSGQFAVRIEPGKVNIEAKRLGFMQSTLAMRLTRDTTIEIVMLPSAGQLKAVVITERARTGLERLGFYDRQEQAKRGLLNGTFITPEDVAKRNPSAISQMLGNVQGLTLQNSAGRQIPVGGDGSCVMTIFLDGAQTNNTRGTESAIAALQNMERVNGTADGPMGRGSDHGGIDLVMSAHQLAAIEVYPRLSSAPIKYQPLSNNCGVILLWTKDGASREAGRK